MKIESDHELVERYRGGDESAFGELYFRYIKLISMLAGVYGFSSADESDLIQEGLTGLWAAVKRFDPEREGASSFGTYAYLCIQSRIKNAVKKLSADTPTDFSDHSDLGDEYSVEADDAIIERELFRERVVAVLETLSSFEKDVFILYMRGYTYREIAAILKKSPKSVDNALARIKTKARASD